MTPDTRAPLGVGTQLGYGVGNLGLQVATNAAIVYLLYFYTDVVALSPLLVGVALTLVILPDR